MVENDRTAQIVPEIEVQASVQSFINDLSSRVFPDPVAGKDAESIVPIALEIVEITNQAEVFIDFNMLLIRPPFGLYEEQEKVNRDKTITNVFYDLGEEVDDVKKWGTDNYGFFGNAGSGAGG